MSTAIVKNPDKIECTLSFTMRLDDWKQVRKTLNSNAAYAELKLIDEISDLVYQLEQTFFQKGSEE